MEFWVLLILYSSVFIIQSQILSLVGLLPTITFVTKVTIVRIQLRKYKLP